MHGTPKCGKRPRVSVYLQFNVMLELKYASSIDLDLPNACDDGYWYHPNASLAFKQPEGCPSRVDILLYYLKLYQAVAPAMCLIVSIVSHSPAQAGS